MTFFETQPAALLMGWSRMQRSDPLRKRTFEHSIQQHGGKRFRKLLKCIA